MKTKQIIIASLITFLIGGLGGSAYAYATHNNRDLPHSLAQAQENREVEQFITEQENMRPDGMSESKIATGSRYTGITYNNVSPATTNEAPTSTDAPAVPEEKESFWDKLFGKKDKRPSNDDQQSDPDAQQDQQATATGRIAIQDGSLNVRSQSSLEGTVVGQVYKDDTVEILGQEGAWYHIVTASGLQGYVSATYVEIISGTV